MDPPSLETGARPIEVRDLGIVVAEMTLSALWQAPTTRRGRWSVHRALLFVPPLLKGEGVRGWGHHTAFGVSLPPAPERRSHVDPPQSLDSTRTAFIPEASRWDAILSIEAQNLMRVIGWKRQLKFSSVISHAAHCWIGAHGQ